MIEQAVIDISFGSEAEAFEQQTALSELARNRLMDVVDDVFNEFSPAGAVCRFENLEIDLGIMDYIGFPVEMERRLREQLRLVLQEKLPALHGESMPRKGILPLQRTELEHVTYFLISGRLLWNASFKKGQTLEDKFRHVLHASGQPFAEFLRRSAHGVIAVQRLVRQFPEEILSKVLKLLAPSQAGSLVRLVDDLQTMRKANGFVKAGAMEFSRLIWEQLLLELQKTGRTGSDTENVLSQLVKRIALYESTNYSQMLIALVAGAEQAERREGCRLTVTNQLQGLCDEEEQFHREASETERTSSVMDDGEVNVSELWTVINEISNGTTQQKRTASTLLDGDLATETDVSGGLLASTEVSAESRALIRIFDLYDELYAHLLQGLGARGQGSKARGKGVGGRDQELNGEEQEAVGVIGLIEVLEREAPWLLLRLYRELQINARSEVMLETQLSEKALRRLITAFLAIMPQVGADGRTELLRTIDINVRRAMEPRRVYRQILQCLLLDEPIDFDILLMETRSRGEEDREKEEAKVLAHRDGQNERSLERAEEPSFLPLSGQLAERLTQCLKNDARVSPEEVALCSETIQHILAEEPDRLRQLTVLLEYPDAAERLVVLLSESLKDKEKNNIKAQVFSDGQQARFDKPVQAQAFSQPSSELEGGLLHYLKEGGRVSSEEAIRLGEAVECLLAEQPHRFRQLAEPLLGYANAADRLIGLLSERLLTRVLALLRPFSHAQAQRCAELIATACAGLTMSLTLRQLRHLKWQCLFRYLLEEGRSFDEGVFVRRFVTYLTEQMHGLNAHEFSILLRRELTLITLPSTRAQHQAIFDALTQTVETKPLSEADTRTANLTISTDSLEEEERDYREQIYIANAGLVLAAPYLPRLFEMLNVTEHSVFADPIAAERAVHLLQFMVNEQTDAPEYQLVLNKLLCGVRTGIPIQRKISISHQEQDTIEGLLQGMIQNWKSIGQTSVAGLRESFLQREGRLQRREDTWHLLVEPKAFDMLLDQIPWSFSMIKHPWMERMLYVEWR